jgi:hypothetical protein
MKSLNGWTKLLLAGLGVVCSLVVFSCAQNPHNQTSSDRVAFDKYGVFVPGTPISESDERALNAILQHHNKALYRIDVYKGGKLEKTLGGMSVGIIGKAEVSEIAENAKLHALSGWTIQLGYPGFNAGGRTTKQPNSPIPRTVKPSPPPSQRAEVRELIQQVKTIVVKYGDHVGGQ